MVIIGRSREDNPIVRLLYQQQNGTSIHTYGYSLLGYLKPVCAKNSSLIRRGLVKRNKTLELPALSLVPLALLPPKDCWPMRAAVVLQSARCSLLVNGT